MTVNLLEPIKYVMSQAKDVSIDTEALKSFGQTYTMNQQAKGVYKTPFK
jgi:hypothetical protein